MCLKLVIVFVHVLNKLMQYFHKWYVIPDNPPDFQRVGVQYFLATKFFPLTTQNRSYPKFLSSSKLNGEMSMQKKPHLINKERVLFTKFCVLVTEHPEFLGSGKDDNCFVYIIEQEVSPKRNLEVWIGFVDFYFVFPHLTKILLKLFSLEMSLGVFELIYSASLILFCIIF